MRRVVSAVFLIVFLLCTFVLAQEDGLHLTVTAETASLRVSPEINAEIVSRLAAGTTLRSLGKTGNWYQVETIGRGNRVRGYIHASMVALLDRSEREAKREMAPDPGAKKGEGSQSTEAYASGIILGGGLSLAGFSYGSPGMTFYDDTEFLNRKRGFLGGLSFDMGGKLGIEFGFFYMQKGAEWSGSVTMKRMQLSGTARIEVDELSAPVLMKIRFGPYSAPFVVLGAELAYVLSGKYSWVLENTQLQLDETGSEDIVTLINRMDYGLVVGAGFELKLKRGGLLVQGRYHLGLADIYKQEDVSGTEDSWVRSNAFVAMLGLKF